MVHEKITSSLDVRHIPYNILRQLSQLLDIPGDRDWNALIAQLPSEKYRYDIGKINKLNMAFQRPGGSPSMSLLTDFGQQLMKVGELVTYLEAINHQEALLLLKPHEPVQITRHPDPVAAQAGESILLKCVASGFPEPTYQWFKNDSSIGTSSNELKLNNVREDTSGNYYCKVTNPIGSEYSRVAQVQVTPVYSGGYGGQMLPQSHAGHSLPPDQGCAGSTEKVITLYLGQSFSLTCDKPALSYQWYRNSYPFRGACNNNLFFNTFLAADEGCYSCLIDDGQEQVFTELVHLKCREMTVGGDIPTNQEFATGKLALIIANQNYNNPSYPGKLIHPVDDAMLLHEKLETIGFKVFSFKNLTRKEIKAAVNGFCKILTCSRELYSLFYFCGHGFEENGKTYLVPVDEGLDWNCRTAIAAEEILSDIQQQGCTKLDVLLLDVCRTREPSAGERYDSINPAFKAGSQCVFGYATCPQSQSYEVRQHPNGIYMKHLSAHITENIQIEQMLHKVGVAVRQEAERHSKTNKMSPTYNSTTTKVFSLCDKVLPAGFITGERDPEEVWFRYHRLPAPKLIHFDHGIKVEVKFSRAPYEMSNICSITISVVDMGPMLYCDAELSEEAIVSKCLLFDSLETSTTTERPSEYERWTEVQSLQRLDRPFEATVNVIYQFDERSPAKNMTQRLEFPLEEFGILPFFVPPPHPMVYLDAGMHSLQLR